MSMKNITYLFLLTILLMMSNPSLASFDKEREDSKNPKVVKDLKGIFTTRIATLEDLGLKHFTKNDLLFFTITGFFESPKRKHDLDWGSIIKKNTSFVQKLQEKGVPTMCFTHLPRSYEGHFEKYFGQEGIQFYDPFQGEEQEIPYGSYPPERKYLRKGLFYKIRGEKFTDSCMLNGAIHYLEQKGHTFKRYFFFFQDLWDASLMTGGALYYPVTMYYVDGGRKLWGNTRRKSSLKFMFSDVLKAQFAVLGNEEEIMKKFRQNPLILGQTFPQYLRASDNKPIDFYDILCVREKSDCIYRAFEGTPENEKSPLVQSFFLGKRPSSDQIVGFMRTIKPYYDGVFWATFLALMGELIDEKLSLEDYTPLALEILKLREEGQFHQYQKEIKALNKLIPPGFRYSAARAWRLIRASDKESHLESLTVIEPEMRSFYYTALGFFPIKERSLESYTQIVKSLKKLTTSKNRAYDVMMILREGLTINQSLLLLKYVRQEDTRDLQKFVDMFKKNSPKFTLPTLEKIFRTFENIKDLKTWRDRVICFLEKSKGDPEISLKNYQEALAYVQSHLKQIEKKSSNVHPEIYLEGATWILAGMENLKTSKSLIDGSFQLYKWASEMRRANPIDFMGILSKINPQTEIKRTWENLKDFYINHIIKEFGNYKRNPGNMAMGCGDYGDFKYVVQSFCALTPDTQGAFLEKCRAYGMGTNYEFSHLDNLSSFINRFSKDFRLFEKQYGQKGSK